MMLSAGGITNANTHHLHHNNANNASGNGNTPGNNTSLASNNSGRMLSGGYRPIPQSKNEADANPDIIPDSNSFSTGKKITSNIHAFKL